MTNIVENFKEVTKNWQDFKGRATRSEFWNYVLALAGVTIVANILDSLLFGHQNPGLLTGGLVSFILFKGDLFNAIGPIGKLAALILIVPALTAAFRRMHDTGKSAWWLLVYIFPIIGWAFGIYFMSKDSDAENAYGKNPKQIG